MNLFIYVVIERNSKIKSFSVKDIRVEKLSSYFSVLTSYNSKFRLRERLHILTFVQKTFTWSRKNKSQDTNFKKYEIRIPVLTPLFNPRLF